MLFRYKGNTHASSTIYLWWSVLPRGTSIAPENQPLSHYTLNIMFETMILPTLLANGV